MKKIYLFAGTLFVSLLGVAQNPVTHSDQLTFSGKMDGAQAGITTSALGVGAFTLNGTMDTMCYEISTNGLSGAITAIHLHSGMMGQTGPVAIDLTGGIDNNIVSGTITGTELSTNLASFLAGGLYINLHTTANAGGEIRGQVYLEKDMLFSSDLAEDGSGSTGIGLGSFQLSHDKSTINYIVVADGLTGAISDAHLHFGSTGTSGGVAMGLGGDIVSGNSIIKGSFLTSAASAGFMDSLMVGSIYLNIHTMANPGGEIRGQLMKSNNLAFDATMDTMQQTAPVTGMNIGMGVSIFEINPTLDTIWYNTVVTGVTGPITAIHLHRAMMGMDGSVEVDMTSNILGNRVMGMVTGAAVTNDLITKMLRGETYLNLHTATNANGELRGQLFKFARDGYRMSLSGDQLVPAVTVSAQGAGVVTIDRDATNAHFMVVMSGLTDVVTASHFHVGVNGENGGVAYDLSSFYSMSTTDDAAMGYWTNTDATTPFMASNATQFWMDSIYIVVHTAANPGGELRGQAWRSAECMNILGLEEAKATYVSLYPNPSSTEFTVRTEKVIANISILGSDGKEVKSLSNSNSSILTVNIDDIADGMYTVLLTFEDGTRGVTRMIKN